MAGAIVTHSSLLVAIFVYLGWAYEEAYYSYFHLHPIGLGASILEYLLSSISLFRLGFVLIAVAVMAAIGLAGGSAAQAGSFRSTLRRAARPWMPQFIRSGVSYFGTPQSLQIAIGAAATITALVLANAATYFPVSTYVLLGLFASGPLLLTRARLDTRSRTVYILATVITTASVIWAGSIYAHNVGASAARRFVATLPAQTAAALYSPVQLALSGPGVTVEKLPPGYKYEYRYLGLRVLTERSGTYYLLPVGWAPKYDLTYTFEDDSDTRIELYSGDIPSPYPNPSAGIQLPESP
jgi:hypothetical protein